VNLAGPAARHTNVSVSMDIYGFLSAFIQILANILMIAIIGRALISWFPVDPRGPIVSILTEITEPVLAPLRRVVPRIGMIDITPMVAIFVLVLIQRVAADALA
jgi:YggT family protein